MLGLLIIFCREAFARFFLFLSLKNLFSQSGVGLIGVMISAAVMVPVALVSVQIHKNMLVAQKDVERRYSVDHLFQDIRSELGDTVICTRTLRTYLVDMKLPTEEEGTADLPSIKTKDGTGDLHVKGGIYEGGNAKIKEMEVSHLTRDTSGGNTGTAIFTAHFEKGSAEQVGLTDFKPRDLELMVVMNLDVAGEPTTVKRCWAKFAGQNLSLLESCKGRIDFVKNNCPYTMPPWLSSASTSDEIVELTGDNEVIWHEGTWNDGTWCTSSTKLEHCLWKGGTWTSGTWNNGIWQAGEWFGSPVDGADWKAGLCKDKTHPTPPPIVCYDPCVPTAPVATEGHCVVSKGRRHSEKASDAVTTCEAGYLGKCESECNNGNWLKTSRYNDDDYCHLPRKCSAKTISSLDCSLKEVEHEGTSGDCNEGYAGKCKHKCNDETWEYLPLTSYDPVRISYDDLVRGTYEESYNHACRPFNTCSGSTLVAGSRSCHSVNPSSGVKHGEKASGTCGPGYVGECGYTCVDGRWNSPGFHHTCRLGKSCSGTRKGGRCNLTVASHGVTTRGRCEDFGSCRYRCHDGEWEPSTDTCRAGRSCSNTSFRDSSCKVLVTSHGDKSGTCASDYVGECKFKCFDSIWKDTSPATSNTCRLPNNCLGDKMIEYCSLASVGSGRSSGTCPYGGECSYTCNDGRWTKSLNTCGVPRTCDSEIVGFCNMYHTLAKHDKTYQGLCTVGSIYGYCGYKCNDGNWEKVRSECGCNTETKDNCNVRITQHDTVQAGTCAEGYTGECSYECNDGTWQSASTDFCSATCVATTTSDNCELSASEHGQSGGECAGGYTGGCRYECVNGTWKKMIVDSEGGGGSLCQPAVWCDGTWGYNHCQLLPRIHGKTSGRCILGGGCSYTCVNGTWSKNSNTCVHCSTYCQRKKNTCCAERVYRMHGSSTTRCARNSGACDGTYNNCMNSYRCSPR